MQNFASTSYGKNQQTNSLVTQLPSVVLEGRICHGQKKQGPEEAPTRLHAFCTCSKSASIVIDSFDASVQSKTKDCTTAPSSSPSSSPSFSSDDDAVWTDPNAFFQPVAHTGGGNANIQQSATIFSPEIVGPFNERLNSAILAAGQLEAAQGRVPKILTLGGDHSLAIGSVSASAILAKELAEKKLFNFPVAPSMVSRSPTVVEQDSGDSEQKEATTPTSWLSTSSAGTSTHNDAIGELVVFWIDAHADINTPDTTASGNLHGCPVSLLCGVDPKSWEPLSKDLGWTDKLLQTGRMGVPSESRYFVSPARVVYIGLRDVEEGEQAIIDALGMREYPMHTVRKRNRDIAGIIAEALQAVDPEGRRPIHCSFDVDGLDPLYAPSTGTAVQDGLTLDEGVEIVSLLRDTGRLFAMDLVEVNPALGTEQDVVTTLASAGRLISAFTQSSR